MRRKISNVICVLLISSLTLLGCNSENNTTNTEKEYITKQSIDSETEEMTTEKISTEEISTEEISTEEFSTEEISTEISNTEVPSEESNPTDVSKEDDTPVNTNSDKGTKNTDTSDNTENANSNSNKTNNTTENNTGNNDTTSQTVPEASTPQASSPEAQSPEAPSPETSTPAVEQPADPYFIDSNAEQVLALVNQARAEVGLPGLTLNSTLLSAAHVRASEIAVSFSHTRPDGRSCFTAWDEAGVTYMTAGENIAAGQTSPEDVMNSWLNSPGHYANITNANFTELAVGCYYVPGSEYGYYWVQCFI